MIVLPASFVKTKYAGYFWNIPEKRLYSCKVDGILRPIKLRKAFKNHPAGYRVSVFGLRVTLSLEYLSGLKYPKSVEVFPMEKHNEN